ncbi:MAG: heavy metal-responsive transcriptional regulator [Actinomycetota bacterium]|nr:heavy metal-responsive transcriptional regulator [Actinomycetota bacterium]
MRIGELAERMALNPRTIRYYESIGLLPDPERTASGYRAYGEADVDRLAFIRSAQRLGLALDEIREVFALRDRGEAPCAYVRGLISKEIVEIDRRLKELRGLRQELVALDQRADKADAGSGRVCGLIEHVRQRVPSPPAPASR